ncbi:hypothetical protein DMC30DRAFT_194471 [Rhodotorula diobovata]|uniref:Uncharacterized protein n=1 Tax=Rhodotorula diobovata TaxID=5288 RepID=A0A5C5FY82_9BASI|nr:hypothetical protein DMC30DRAFT_194471 [Rhodotorula diobovata]
MSHGGLSWTARQSLLVALADVLVKLRRVRPHDVFVLGGLQSLDMYAHSVDAAASLAGQHGPKLADLLPQTAFCTSDAPIVFDMVPSRFVRPGDLQQALWGPSAPDSPFHTSTFLCTVHGVGTLGHVRILGLPGAPSIITDKALVSTVQSSTVHTKCLTWCALIAEQLVLGATSTNDDAFHAALSAIRYAWRVGVAASSARGARDRLESERAAAQRGLLHALREMLGSERGDTVIRTWQHRFSDEVFVGKAVHWETTRLPHVATTAGLYEEYREVQLAIGHVLDQFSRHFAHGVTSSHEALQMVMAADQLSLAKSSFEPAQRTRGDSRAVFA